MKFITIWIFLFSWAAAEYELTPADKKKLEKLEAYSAAKKEARNNPHNQEIEKNILWIIQTFYEDPKEGKKPNLLDVEKLESLYSNGGKKVKLTALGVLPITQTIEDWLPELSICIKNEDKDYAYRVSNIIMSKLQNGTQREKIILANENALLGEVKKLVSRFPEDVNFPNWGKKIDNLAEPYKGKNIPDVGEKSRRKGFYMSQNNDAKIMIPDQLSEAVEEIPAKTVKTWSKWIILIVVVALIGLTIYLKKKY